MATCINCGSSNEQGASSCNYCSKSLAQSESATFQDFLNALEQRLSGVSALNSFTAALGRDKEADIIGSIYVPSNREDLKELALFIVNKVDALSGKIGSEAQQLPNWAAKARQIETKLELTPQLDQSDQKLINLIRSRREAAVKSSRRKFLIIQGSLILLLIAMGIFVAYMAANE